MQYDDVITDPIWRTAAIMKTVFGYIATIYCPINAKFGRKKQNHVLTLGHMTKIPNFKNQDGGWPPF